ncbi:MAG: FemAB family XrtA/PEP-CTERM system-associated protein [Pseudomonadota bacterium]
MNAPVKLTLSVTLADLTDPQQVARIERFVADRDGAVFQRPIWLQSVERGTGQVGFGFVAERMGVVCGWLPLTEVRSALFGKALVSSGFGVGGGILADDGEVTASLARAAVDHADANSIPGIELRGGAIPAQWRSWEDSHAGFARSLAMDDEAELLAIPRKARAEVRKALKYDLEVRVGTSADDRKAHYAVYSESVRNLGTPVFPKSLFNAMLDAFADSSDILTVFAQGKPVASVLSFYHQGHVMPYWGGGISAARGLRANELMYFKLMGHARRKGMNRFDFGRSKTNSGPYRFKKNWGFEPEPLVYGEWTADGAKNRNINPNSQAYSRKIELWKKLPLPIANALGPLISRGLA